MFSGVPQCSYVSPSSTDIPFTVNELQVIVSMGILIIIKEKILCSSSERALPIASFFPNL